MSTRVLNQKTGDYLTDDEVIRMAVAILTHRFGLTRASLNSPGAVRDYLRLTLANKEHEVFVCVCLDAQNRVIAVEELFRGTLTQTSVYPREVVKMALHHNAASLPPATTKWSSTRTSISASAPLSDVDLCS